MKVAAIIQARMGSTRLPGKILKKVLDKTLLEYQIERVKRVKTIDEIIIATTKNENDDQIVQLCQELSIPYYRGAEEDVLSRYYETATKFDIDVVVRLTSDCPIIDPKIVDLVIEQYLNYFHNIDYISNVLERTYPRGMDTEVFSYQALKAAYLNATEQTCREHVTPYIYWNPEQFKLRNVAHYQDLSKYRWTVDTSEDFELIKRIIENLYPQNPFFTMDEVVTLLNQYPEWGKINAHIEQQKNN